MKTIALRFSDNFAPKAGTIYEHKKMIQEHGYVWYGKLGAKVSDKVRVDILNNDCPKILLIHSGKSFRYWAYITEITKETPPLYDIPEYYREKTNEFKTWFRVVRIVEANKNVMSACKIASSGASLSLASKSSINPYFIIDYNESEDVNA